MIFYFYLMKCRDGTLYSGVAKDLARREALHNAGKGSAYVRSRGGGKIAYSERFRSASKALRREAEVKKFTRTAKLSLIRAAGRKK